MHPVAKEFTVQFFHNELHFEWVSLFESNTRQLFKVKHLVYSILQ